MHTPIKFETVFKGRIEISENGKVVRFTEKDKNKETKIAFKVSKIESIEYCNGRIKLTMDTQFMESFEDLPPKAYDILCELMANVD